AAIDLLLDKAVLPLAIKPAEKRAQTADTPRSDRADTGGKRRRTAAQHREPHGSESGDGRRHADLEGAALADVRLAGGRLARDIRPILDLARLAIVLGDVAGKPLARDEADLGAIEAVALQIGYRRLQRLGIVKHGDRFANACLARYWLRFRHGASADPAAPLEVTGAGGARFSPRRLAAPAPAFARPARPANRGAGAAARLRRSRSAPVARWQRLR